MLSISISVFAFSILIGLSCLAIVLTVYAINMKRKPKNINRSYPPSDFDEREIFY